MFLNWIQKAHTADWRDRGTLLVEYGMLLMFVMAIAVMAVSAFGSAVVEMFDFNSEEFTELHDRIIVGDES